MQRVPAVRRRPQHRPHHQLMVCQSSIRHQVLLVVLRRLRTCPVVQHRLVVPPISEALSVDSLPTATRSTPATACHRTPPIRTAAVPAVAVWTRTSKSVRRRTQSARITRAISHEWLAFIITIMRLLLLLLHRDPPVTWSAMTMGRLRSVNNT